MSETGVGHPLTEKDCEKFVELSQKGFSRHEISLKTGWSYVTVCRVLSRKMNAPKVKDVKGLVTTGQIAKSLGLSPASVLKALRRLNVDPEAKVSNRGYYAKEIVSQLRETPEFKECLRGYGVSGEKKPDVPVKGMGLRTPGEKGLLCVKCRHLRWKNRRAWCYRTIPLEIFDLDRRSDKCGCWECEPKDRKMTDERSDYYAWGTEEGF